jgi:hypothetical protein
MYNRKQRREIERKTGLMKEYANMPADKQAEVRTRRMAVGKQIHLQNVQAREQYEQEQEALRYAKRIEFVQEIYKISAEEAAVKVDEEYRIENEKWEKRMQRKMKQQG